jgi:bacillolysin
MKMKIILLLIGLVNMQHIASAQIDTLFKINAASFDSAGFVTYSPNSTQPEEPWAIYLATNAAEGSVDGLVLLESAEDQMIHVQHNRYQQTYKGLPVEAAVWKEHVKDGYLVFANGMLATNMQGNPTPVAPEPEALSQIQLGYPQNIFAWMVDEMEAQIQADLGDSAATNYPQGQLLWALDNYAHMSYIIPGNRYRLAWRFELESLYPAFYKAIFVDATTGQVFREDDLDVHNGYGQTWYHGTQPIDTKWAGSITKNILWANDNGRNIHTKKGTVPDAWGLCPNYKNADSLWGGSDLEGTSVHWFASESWDYFQSPPLNYDVNAAIGGVNDKEMRIFVEVDNDGFGARSKEKNGYQIMLFVKNDEQKAIDIVGHEFAHRLENGNGHPLATSGEAGALQESFGDIFGELIERRTEGAIDWVHGADPGTVGTRNFSDPKSDGFHHEIGDENNGCDAFAHSGQPNTYFGDNWYNDVWCDRGGVHSNCSVMNYWFYLLAEGGIDTNDLFDTYNVQGIGIDDVAAITFYSWINILSDGDGYQQARASSIQAAQMLFGQCSNQEIQTTNAWYAVGVGGPSTCPATAVNQSVMDVPSAKVYPNPSSGQFYIDFEGKQARTIVVHDLLGHPMRDYHVSVSEHFDLDLRDLPAGMYYAVVREKSGSFTLKLAKQ